MHAAAPPESAQRTRMRAAAISLAVSVVLLAAKFTGWWLTESQTVFSDAMESTVNVVAALAALFAISFAGRPADEDHPYGHGKIEFVTAGFEGGLIAFAGLAIVHESVMALVEGHAPQRLDLGLAIVAGAGVANLALGLFLLRTGRRHDSPALIADGHHVISDFWTSAGAVAGLTIVQFTGLAWIDAAAALVLAALLFRTGARLLRTAARGLLDEMDPELVGSIAAALEASRREGIIEVHDLRAINTGRGRHVDLHVVVPEFWTVDRCHAEMDAYQHRVVAAGGARAELQFHVDPCERAYCARCDLADCPVRAAPFAARRPFTGDTVARGPQPGSAHDAGAASMP